MKKDFAALTISLAPHLDGEPTTRIAVTGGSGFLGTNLIDFYLAHSATNLVNFDLAPPRNPLHGQLWRPLDLCDEKAVAEEIANFKPDVIFHLGARTDLLGKDVRDYAANVAGVRNLIQSVNVLNSPPRVIFASSRLVCRIGYEPRSESDYCPTNAYGESKVEGEILTRTLSSPDTDWLIVRPTSIWGPWFDTPYLDFFDAVSRGRYVHPGGRRILKSFGFVGNTIFQLDRLMFLSREDTRHRTLYLADYPPLELRAWAEMVATATGRSKVLTAPLLVLRLLGLCGDVASKVGVPSVPLTSFRLNNLLTEMVHDTTLLEEVVGSLPFDLTTATRITIDWLNKLDSRESLEG